MLQYWLSCFSAYRIWKAAARSMALTTLTMTLTWRILPPGNHAPHNATPTNPAPIGHGRMEELDAGSKVATMDAKAIAKEFLDTTPAHQSAKLYEITLVLNKRLVLPDYFTCIPKHSLQMAIFNIWLRNLPLSPLCFIFGLHVIVYRLQYPFHYLYVELRYSTLSWAGKTLHLAYVYILSNSN